MFVITVLIPYLYRLHLTVNTCREHLTRASLRPASPSNLPIGYSAAPARLLIYFTHSGGRRSNLRVPTRIRDASVYLYQFPKSSCGPMIKFCRATPGYTATSTVFLLFCTVLPGFASIFPFQNRDTCSRSNASGINTKSLKPCFKKYTGSSAVAGGREGRVIVLLLYGTRRYGSVVLFECHRKFAIKRCPTSSEARLLIRAAMLTNVAVYRFRATIPTVIQIEIS